MKKKKIELSRKLFLNKETICNLDVTARQQILGGAGMTGDEKCIRPVDNGHQWEVAMSSPVAVGACNFAKSGFPAGCHATGSPACNTLADKCGNGISVAGGICDPA